MKRKILFAGVAVLALGLLHTIAEAQRGSGGQNSAQYAVGRAPVASPARPAAAADYAYGETANDAVEMILKVPAKADVWFNGAKTDAQAKAVRHFVTAALEPGQDYYYDVRVRWTESGRALEQTRRVLVRAGDRLTLNFMDVPRSIISR
jgi:uncharacterized protein (TIGR03000 family)